MEKKTIDIVIPAYRPGEEFKELIRKLMGQSVRPEHIYIMQTVEEAGETMIQPEDERIEVFPVLQPEFDHGGTRDRGAKISQSEFVVFMTQDAVPADDRVIENLLKAMEDPKTGIAYARQLARPKADLLERMTREYNYPPESLVKSAKDQERMGIKTYFCSDVCAMYRKEYYDKMGGFVSPAIFNEDMIMAYRMIQAGYQVAYCADARVIHSHNYNCRQQFSRNFDLGVSQKEYEEIFASISSEKEGAGYAMSTLKALMKRGHFGKAFYFALQCGFKLAGYKLGLHYDKLPKKWVLFCTGSRWYWK